MSSTKPIQEALTQSVVSVLIDGVMALLMLVVMFIYSPLLAGIVLLSAVLLIAQEEAIYAKAIENTHVIESIRANTTVKLFGRESEREAAWRNLYSDFINASVDYGKYLILQKFAETLINGLQIVIVVWAAATLMMDTGSLTTNGGFTLGMLIAFLAYRQYFTDSVAQLLQKGIEFRLLSLHLDRLSDIIFEENEKADHVTETPEIIKGHVTVESVSFRYADTDPYVLEDVSLDIPLYSPTAGHVKIDGQDLDAIGLAHWRSHIGVVMQDDRLLSGTIADNIAFFDPEIDMLRRLICNASPKRPMPRKFTRRFLSYLCIIIP